MNRNHTWINIFDKYYFLFKVRACTNAHIDLSSNPQLVDGFEYDIGFGTTDSNDISVTNVRTNNIVSSQKSNIVSCDAFRYFWIAWTSQMLHIGEGQIIREKQILLYAEVNNTLTPFQYVGLRGGQGSDVEWEFSQSSGNKQLFLNAF